jgi:hypothetical protein
MNNFARQNRKQWIGWPWSLIILMTVCVHNFRNVDAFFISKNHRLSTLASVPLVSQSHLSRLPTSSYPAEKRRKFILSIKNNDDDEEWILAKRFQNADVLEIRRDAVLVTCFVLGRFLVYDIFTSAKVTPGWEVQDIIWLTGTFSSSVVLVVYWTIAGLLSRSFESTTYGPVQVLVNVALCCPIWLATEHLFGFGPSNIGGSTLSEAVASGFVSLASWMVLSRTLTQDWER